MLLSRCEMWLRVGDALKAMPPQTRKPQRPRDFILEIKIGPALPEAGQLALDIWLSMPIQF